MSKEKLKNILTISFSIIMLIMVIEISYAAFQFKGPGNKLNTITTGAISMSYEESENTISLNNALPTTQATGKKQLGDGEYFDFTVKSSIKGNMDINYEIVAQEEDGNTFSSDNIYYYLTKVNSNGSETEVMAPRKYYAEKEENIYTGRPAGVFSMFTGNLAEQGETSITYRLRLWVDETYNPQNDDGNQIYKTKINVYGAGSNNVALLEDQYCYNNGFTTLSDCMLVMNNHEKSVEEAKTAIKAKGTPDFSKIAPNDSETDGLYMTEDDEGESYYYRGAVRNNYVSFAGFLWRIIRRNGDGSVRMIYSGKSVSDTGDATTIGKSQFNSKFWDPTYVGYKYNEDFSLYENNESIIYRWFTNTQKYDYGTGYTFDESTKKFTLTGDIKQLTWNDNHDEIVSNQLYSCLNTSCNVVYKVTGYSDANTMKVQPISYSSNSLLSAQTNTTDSPIKITLDNWYKENLINYSSYLADETFCNDRSLTYGDGYKLDSFTQYGPYNRLFIKNSPSLKCSQDNDKFRVSGTSAKLDYPVGLILADEVALAGGNLNSVNSNYYLYNASNYFTFSPSSFTFSDSTANIFTVYYYYFYLSIRATDTSYVRAVINLKRDVTISKGDGSALNPFVVKFGS
ncbi:unknown [Clostridium sp. CAG:451]|nr:unknown [Clostridium sp. CAG:451]